MVNVRIKDLPPGPAPSLTDVVAVDGAQTRPNTLQQILAIFSPSFASSAQGLLASTALQPGANIPWSNVTGKPTFFSGAYADLTGKPTLGLLSAKDTVTVSDVSATGTPNSTTYLRGDGTWSTPAGGGGGGGDMFKSTYDPTNINSSAFDRANHTGSQLAATISNFSTAADARISAAVGVSVQAYAANLTTWAGIAPATGVGAFLATPTSANLASTVTDETGSGALVFATSPTLVTPALGTPSSLTLTNATGLPIIAGTSGTLTVARGGTGLTALTANNLIVGAGTSNPTFIAPGTSGNVLQSNGTTWASVANPSTPGLVLLTTATPSAVAACDFTANINSTYDEYEIHVLNFVPASSGVGLNLLASTNGGSSYLNANGSYVWSYFSYVGSVVGSASNAGNSTSAAIQTCDAVLNAAPGVSGIIRIIRPSNTSPCEIQYRMTLANSATAAHQYVGGGWVAGSTAINAFRLQFAVGNISSGIARLYGVRRV